MTPPSLAVILIKPSILMVWQVETSMLQTLMVLMMVHITQFFRTHPMELHRFTKLMVTGHIPQTKTSQELKHLQSLLPMI